jgi:hypothetical protein
MATVVRSKLYNTLLPSSWFLGTTMRAFHNLRCIWKTQQLFHKVYSQANNFKFLIGGCALGTIYGDRLIIRIAARIVLISQRWTAAIKSKKQLSLCWNAYFRSLFCLLQTPRDADHDETISPDKKGVLPPSYLFRLRQIGEGFKKWIGRTFVIGQHAVTAAFEHSNRIIDLIEAFSTSPEITEQGIREFFINTKELAGNIVQNDHLIIRELEQNLVIIIKIFKVLGFKTDEKIFQKFHTKLLKAMQAAKTSIHVFDRTTTTAKNSARTFTYVVAGQELTSLLPEEDKKNR